MTAIKSPDGAITGWYRQLRVGSNEAATNLWGAYYSRMVGLAKLRLNGSRSASFDEEDVAICAFNVFCESIRSGKFTTLQDRDELWRLIAKITIGQASDHAKAENAQKRGGSRGGGNRWNRLEGGNLASDPAEANPAEADPAILAAMADQCRHLIASLNDTELQTVAMRRMEGYTLDEIAEKMGYSQRTIQRMLKLIRDIWRNNLDV